jgi:hypothetical protein
VLAGLQPNRGKIGAACNKVLVSHGVATARLPMCGLGDAVVFFRND